VDQVHVIRHKVLVEGRSRRQVAKELGISRLTVRKYLEEAAPVRKETMARPRPIWDAVRERVDGLLAESGRWTGGKQQLTATRLHALLVSEGHRVGVTLVKEAVAEWKRQRREVFVPLTYRPGTRMPTAFPDGKTTLPDILGGSVENQTASIWAFLSEGDQAALPVGLVTGQQEIVAFDEAVIYRNFIEGAGTRAIGVGYPEKLNLAFDANNLRLAMLWYGGFIDANKHWSGRGAGFEGPLGDNILRLPEGAPLAVLESSDTAWPKTPARESGYQFRGYKLGEKMRPAFLYSFDGVAVEDDLRPVGEQDVFVMSRTLTFTADKPPAKLYFRAITADKIEDAGESGPCA